MVFFVVIPVAALIALAVIAVALGIPITTFGIFAIKNPFIVLAIAGTISLALLVFLFGGRKKK